MPKVHVAIVITVQDEDRRCLATRSAEINDWLDILKGSAKLERVVSDLIINAVYDAAAKLAEWGEGATDDASNPD